MTLMVRDPETGLLLYTPMIKHMEDIMAKKKKRSKQVDDIFKASELPFANKSIKSGNYYILDKYDLLIRKLDQNKVKSAYGWIYDKDGDPINIHINKVLLDTNSQDITVVTLQQLKIKFPNLFKPPRGQIWRVYNNLNFEDIDISNI